MSISKPQVTRVIACCGSMAIISGAERMTFEVLSLVIRNGGRVHCIVNTWANSDRPGLPHPIVENAASIGASWSTGYYWYRLDRHTRSPLKIVQMLWDILMTSAGLLRDALRVRPTHLLFAEFHTVLRNWPAVQILRLCGVRSILHVHNPPAENTFYRRLWKLAIGPSVDRIIGCARHVADNILRTGVDARKVGHIPNMAPRRAPLPASDASTKDWNKVIYIGQIIPEKGIDLLLDAIAIVAHRGLEVTLDIAGEMESWALPDIKAYRDRLRDRASLPDLQHRVRFLGFREDIPQCLAQAAVHCLPSLASMGEGLPLAVLEAKRVGIPTVAFALEPFRELIQHQQDGYLCPELTTASLAEGLYALLHDRRVLEQAGARAQASAERFTAEKFAAAWNRELTGDHVPANSL